MGGGSTSGGPRERNLLFGVIAVQNHFVTPHQLAIAASSWATQPERELAEILVTLGFLDEKKQELITRLLDLQVETHGGDTQATLSSFGGNRAVIDSFSAGVAEGEERNKSLLSFGGTGEAVPEVEMTPERPAPAADKGGASLMSFGGRFSVPTSEGPVPISRLDDYEQVTNEHPGRYNLKCEHGRGGIGRVMVAFDKHMGRDVALKELLPEKKPTGFTSTPSGISPSRFTAAMARFLREARITGQLEHPGIVPVYEIGRRGDGTLYYTMKLVRGDTLSARLKKSRSLAERLHYLNHFLALCQAVAYAHSREVIHRDLKPQNVMVGEFGETVVLDWGMAKATRTSDLTADDQDRDRELIALSSDKTLDGQALGTPSYMSPEQAEGKVAEIDERSDVWSLGAILYVLLTGRPPFIGDLAYEVIGKVITQPITPVLELSPQAPPELAAICEKCLNRDRSKRYANAGELAEDVARFQAGGLVSAYEYSMTALASKWIKKRWPLVLTLAAALLVLAVVGTWSFLRIRRERNTAILREKEAKNNLALACVETGRNLEEKNFLNEARIFYAAALLTHDDPEARSGLFRELTNPLRTRLLMMARLPTKNMRGAAFTGDGKMAAAGVCDQSFNNIYCLQSSIHVLAIPSGKEIFCLGCGGAEGKGDSRRALTFTPDGRGILSAYCESFKAALCLAPAVRQWDVFTGRLVRTLVGPRQTVTSVTVSPDGRYFAASSCAALSDPEKARCGKGEILFWEAEKLAGDQVPPAFTIQGHEALIENIIFTPDSSRIVSAGYDNRVMIWNVKSGALEKTLLGHHAEVYALAVSSDGKWLASGSDNNDVILWNLATGDSVAVFLGHRDSLTDLSFSPDHRFLASSSDDHTIKLWDLETRKCIRTITGYADAVQHIAYAADGKTLMSSSLDGVLRVWEILYVKSGGILTGHQDWIRGVAVSRDHIIATASFDGTIRLWNEKGQNLKTLKAVETNSVVFSPDGKLLGYGGKNGELGIVEMKPGYPARSFAGHNDRVRDIRFSADGKLLISAAEDAYIKVWEAETGKVLEEYFCDNFKAYSAIFLPDGKTLLSGCSDNSLRRWDRETGVDIDRLYFPSEIRYLALSPDHRVLAVGTTFSKIFLLDFATWEQTHVLEGHKKIVLGFAFSPDGKYLASASGDNTARLWDVTTGKELYSMAGHTKYVWAVAYSPDGKWIVTGCGDLTARIWPILPQVFQTPPAVLWQEAVKETGLTLDGFKIKPYERPAD